MIDGSEKRIGRVNFEFQSPHVIEKRSNADSYRDLDLKQIYKQQEKDKKRLYMQRVMDVEHGTFTPSVFQQRATWEKSTRDTITGWQS